MKTFNKFFLILSLIVVGNLTRPALAGDVTPPSSGELTVPWEAFQQLLKLNTDDVSLTWDEFQKLLRQTGVETPPPFEMKNGNVVLTRAEFKALLEKMQSPLSEAPKGYLTKASYSGTVHEEATDIQAVIDLDVVGKDASRQPLRINLFPGQVALKEIFMDGQPALIENDGSWLVLIVMKPGHHVIKARFSASSSLRREPHQIYFPVPKTPMTEISLTVPLPKLDIKVAGASSQETFHQDAITRVHATLPVGENISVSWNAVAPEKDKGPAKIYADLYSLISVDDDGLRVKSAVQLDVLQNSINVLNVTVPNGYNVLNVEGEAVGDWSVKDGEQKILVVPFTYSRKGTIVLTISAEKILAEKNNVVSFDGFQVLKAIREKGFVGVELKSSAEVKIPDVAGIDRMDVQEAPQQLLNLTERPLVYAYKYFHPPFSLSLDIQKHQEVAVISTVIDEANAVTLVTEDGKTIHHLTYSIRNSWKQFLELSLPADAQVWGVTVEGQRVNPSKNSQGKLLIPLNRSKAAGNQLTAFDVEIMYYVPEKNWPLVGKRQLYFPVPDVVVSQMFWSVYLPADNDYLYFGGEVEKEKRASGLRPLMSAALGGQSVLRDLERTTVSGGELYSSSVQRGDLKDQRLSNAKSSSLWKQRGAFSQAQVDEAGYARQVEREINFFNQVKHEALSQSAATAAPIRVNVPNTGKVYRFTKQILVDQTPLALSTVYVAHSLMVMLGLALFTAIGALLYRKRNYFRGKIAALREIGVRHEAMIRRALQPLPATGIAFLIFVFSLMISRLLAIPAFVLFAAALARLGFVLYQSMSNVAE